VSAKPLDDADHSRTHKRERLQRILTDSGRCSLCPPHGGENAGYSARSRRTYSRHGARKQNKRPAARAGNKEEA